MPGLANLFLQHPHAMLVIDKLAKDLSTNRMLALITLHGARGLDKLKAKSTKVAGPKRGLKFAAADLANWIETLNGQLNFAELDETKHFCQYDAFLRIIERKRADNFSPKERIVYYRFISLLLIYLFDKSETSQELASSMPFRELNDFEVEPYIRRLISCSTGTEIDQVLFGGSSPGSSSHLIEVLKSEFFIENPTDRGIAYHFKTRPDEPTNYLCYRFTTRQNFRKTVQNKITKSLLQIFEPSGQMNVFHFQHIYQDEDTVFRRTRGVVLHLPQAFYLGGTSRREDRNVAVGIKTIAIPSSPLYQMHDRDFMWGLFLSTDSTFNPIVGRLLLVRTPEGFDQDSSDNFRRISEKDFISDVEKFALGKDFLKGRTDWLRHSIRNYETKWAGSNTAILSYERVAKP